MKIVEVEIEVTTHYTYRMIWDKDIPPDPSDTEIMKAWNSSTQYPDKQPTVNMTRIGEYNCQKK